MFEIGKIYEATVTKAFIDRRNSKEGGYGAGRFGADQEFPEMHQASIDEEQPLYEGYEFDNYSPIGTLDYKLHCFDGVHVSDYILRCIRKGITEKLVIWKWVGGYKELKEGMKVRYVILGVVDAKEAAKRIVNNRFPFCEKRGIIPETEENYA